MKTRYYEHHKRSFAKTLGFVGLIILSDIIVIYLITQQAVITLKIIIFSNLITGIIYFFHERAWNRIHWGRSHIEIDIWPPHQFP